MRKFFLILSVFSCFIAAGQSPLRKLAKNAVVYDADAQTYINNVQSAGRTLTTAEKGYINTYVVGLKAAGVWDVITDRIIPIWGSEAPSLVTLKGATTVAAVGSPTFGSTGVAFNGTTQYLTTNYAPISNNSVHLAYYSQTDATGGYGEIGSSTGTNRLEMRIKDASGFISRMYTSSNQILTAVTTSVGYWHSCRTASNDHRAYQNGSQIGSTITASPGTRPTHTIGIGALNDDGVYVALTTKTCSLASWGPGSGFNSSLVAADNTLTEAFMDSMGIGVQ